MKWFRKSSARKKKSSVERPEIFVLGSDIVSLSSMTIDNVSDGNYFVKHRLTITENGHVRGSIAAGAAVIRGGVSGGTIRCLDELTIASTAVVDAEIDASVVEVESGAKITGILRVGHIDILPELVEKVEKAKRIRRGEVAVDDPGQSVSEELSKTPPPEKVSEVVYQSSQNEAPSGGSDSTGNWW